MKNKVNLSELKQHIKKLIIEIIQENQLDEVVGGQINVGDVFTLIGDIGIFKKGEKVEVKDKKNIGGEVKITLSNDQGKTDDFTLDIDDDFEELV
jgi:hypothetical protein